MIRWLVISISVGFVLCVGCVQQSNLGDTVLAKVGTKKILVSDVKAISASYLSGKQDIEGVRDYLQTLIDRQLLYMEAQERGWDQDPALIEEMKQRKQAKLLRYYYSRESKKAGDRIKVTDDEIYQYYHEKEFDRMIKVNHARFTREEDAARFASAVKTAAKAATKADGSFERLAEKLGAVVSGVGFVVRGKMDPPTVKVAFALKEGEVSGPIALEPDYGYRVEPMLQQGYRVIQVLGSQPTDFELVKDAVRAALVSEKFAEEVRKSEILIMHQMKLRSNEDAFAVLHQKWDYHVGNVVGLTEEEREMVLYEYDGARMTLAVFTDHVSKIETNPWGTPTDSAKVRLLARVVILHEVLVPEVIKREKVAEDPQLMASLQRDKEEILSERLRQAEVLSNVVYTDEDARRYYEAHPEEFIIPPTAIILDAGFDTEAEAQTTYEKAKSAQDAEAFIRCIPSDRKPLRKYFTLTDVPRNRLAKAAFAANVNEVVGPVKEDGTYHIFKVLSQEEEMLRPFETVWQTAAKRARAGKEDALFEALITRLRSKYADRITIYEQQLGVALQDSIIAARLKLGA